MGLWHINQSVEVYVHCILGTQTNVRSSILGEGGRAKEAQSEFLVLMENMIMMPNLAQSMQRYQLAVYEAKVRLNLAVCPKVWLMSVSMIINTESVVGYNNKLKQAIPGMKLGVNYKVNLDTKKGGPSKINPPNSHPSNPIHKAETQKPPKEPTTVASDKEQKIEPATPQHEINKFAITVGMVGVVALLFSALH